MNLTPGKSTSEFWLNIIGLVLAAAVPLAVAYGLVNQEEADLWVKLILALAAAIVPIVVTRSADKYTAARTELKKEALAGEREMAQLEALQADRSVRYEVRPAAE